MILLELWEQFSVRLTAKSFTFVILVWNRGNLAQACTKSSHFIYSQSAKINAWAGREILKCLWSESRATCNPVSSVWLSTRSQEAYLIHPDFLMMKLSQKQRIFETLSFQSFRKYETYSCVFDISSFAVCRQIRKWEHWTTPKKIKINLLRKSLTFWLMSNDKNEVILFLLLTQLIDPWWECMFTLACLIKAWKGLRDQIPDRCSSTQIEGIFYPRDF